MIVCDKIKLVIWDLDDTFWKGTLSESPVEAVRENIQLVKDLTDRGIVNTICSKNDYEPTAKRLEEIGVIDYFVFKSIDWTPKGQRISQLIKDMGLRQVNCLFIDDNVVNLNEALFYSKELMVAEPTELPQLVEFCKNNPPTDLKHKRLNQYKVLEKKQEAKAEAGNNLKFLYSSNTQVEIHMDCKENVDRIFELINRTNQLNFTKYRCSREELDTLLNDNEANCGYVTVKDNFGDYGIVGFYAVKDNICIHFLFSCRTIGQGVEQWVYSTLGCPELEVVGDVVNNVEKIDAPAWINQGSTDINIKGITDNIGKIVFKGPCDMDILTSFLNVNGVITEFTYVGERKHNVIEHHNHSTNYLQFKNVTKDLKADLDQLLFNDDNMSETAIFDQDLSLLFLSTLIEPNLGIYKNKKTGREIAFGEWCTPLTDESNWNKLISGEYYNYQNTYTIQFLEAFSRDYEYIGQITPAKSFENLKNLLNLINKNAHLCLFLGSEVPYDSNKKDAYKLREQFHKELNRMLRTWAEENERVHIIDFNNYINSQDDFLDNINHFQRNIYYLTSRDVNNLIEKILGYKLKDVSKSKLLLDWIARNTREFFNSESNLYYYLRKFYHTIRGGKN